MKKTASILLIFILLFAFPLQAQAAWPQDIPGNESSGSSEGAFPGDGPNLTGTSAVVMDMDTGDVLYQLNPHEKVYPASTTKLMTALLLVENTSPSDIINVTDGIYTNLIEDAVTIGLIPGEQISSKEILYGMLLPSANDAANAIAEGVAGKVSDFVPMMNNKAADLGCTNTHFANANGLHDDNHYTTPYDMALIATAAYDRSRIREVIKTPNYWMQATNLSGHRELWTTNELLYDVTELYYPDCTGGKTGYTGEAGYTMVAFAEKDHRRIVITVFGCPTSVDRFLDAAALLDFGLKEYHVLRPLQDYAINTEPSPSGTVDRNYYSTLDHPLPSYTIDNGIRFYTRASVTTDDISKNVQLYGTITDGVAGKITLSYKGKELTSVPIMIDESLLAPDRNSMALTTEEKTSDDSSAGKEKSAILGDTLRKYGPGILIAIAAVTAVLILLHLLRRTQEKKRVRVRRYMGDGDRTPPPPAGNQLPEKIRRTARGGSSGGVRREAERRPVDEDAYNARRRRVSQQNDRLQQRSNDRQRNELRQRDEIRRNSDVRERREIRQRDEQRQRNEIRRNNDVRERREIRQRDELHQRDNIRRNSDVSKRREIRQRDELQRDRDLQQRSEVRRSETRQGNVSREARQGLESQRNSEIRRSEKRPTEQSTSVRPDNNTRPRKNAQRGKDLHG